MSTDLEDAEDAEVLNDPDANLSEGEVLEDINTATDGTNLNALATQLPVPNVTTGLGMALGAASDTDTTVLQNLSNSPPSARRMGGRRLFTKSFGAAYTGAASSQHNYYT